MEQPNPFNSVFLQGIIEGLADGILILTSQGEQIYRSLNAQHFCRKLNCGKPTTQVPKLLWRLCQALIDSCTIGSDRPVVIESEIRLEPSTILRVRVKWLALEETHPPYLVVLLEDRRQSLLNRAIAEIQQYKLSPQQAKVWMLRRTGYTYREIATNLYITINTVKRHLKAISYKREQAIDTIEY
ncbi:MAG: LuxR family transcriptional regulator [Scytolyngbya sp. HA4215-MV1]|jgi:DNA-binding CsgD family transcriptional regulator|nr:LuxR family transcriptional regulator [Scytolyngbya sp. HA4215-MV1]